MNVKKRMLDSLSMGSKSLYYRLSIVFALFFLFPVVIFAYFASRYNILADELTPLLALVLLIASFFGYTIIRKIIDDIRATSQDMTDVIAKDMKIIGSEDATSELQSIVRSFHTIKKELVNNISNLKRRVSQISVLKELSDLCYVTFDEEDLFHVTLELALKLVNADIGSVLILEQTKRDAFIVQAAIGAGDILNKGDRVDFAASIAKYAVINKSPLLVDDIEKDMRFKRPNGIRYGTKSFLCMPLKGIKDVIGVLNLSRRVADTCFTQDDVDVLTPLLSSAAFTYDNLNLMKNNDMQGQQLKALYDLDRIQSSSLRGRELLNAFLKQAQLDIPFDLAMILIENENNPNNLCLINSLANFPDVLSRQMEYPYSGTVLERVVKGGSSILLDDLGQWVHPVEQALFLSHHLQSCLLCPLKVDGRIKGVLAVGVRQSNILADAQERIEHLANLVAQAMEMDWLSTSVMKRDQEMGLIKQIGGLLAASTFDRKEVLGHTMDLVRATIEVEAGSILLLDKDELAFSVGFCTDNRVNMETLRDLRLKLGQGISGYCATRGETLMVRDALASKLFYPKTDQLSGFTTRSVLCVPLISQSRVIGVIEVINKRGGEFNKHDQQLLQSIATSASIAMENARLYQKTLSTAEREHGIMNMFQKFVPKEIVDKILHDAETGQNNIHTPFT
jgi:GAF domain-containing protein